MMYLAYHFTVEPPQPGSEILMAVISEMAFESFDVNENGFTAYVKEQQAEEINLVGLLFNDFKYSYNVQKIEPVNWNAEWEKNFEPVVVSDLLCIRAPFHEKNNYVKLEIVIMPKMSFGTGHHQTTRLMCQALFDTDIKNKHVLDMGCGTGILAILAAMLGAHNVLGIDNDAWSVENAIENCTTNGHPEIKIKEADTITANDGMFDIVLANINKNVLKTQMPLYAACMPPGAQLFLSGFFVTDVDEIKNIGHSNGFHFILSQHQNEWAMMKVEKML